MSGRPHGRALAQGDRYVLCLGCQAPRSRKNIRAHYRGVHPDLANLPSDAMFREIPSARPGVAVAVVEQPPPPEDPPLGEDALDDIVLSVVGATSQGGAVPVRHLPALFRWRDATAAFLREVST